MITEFCCGLIEFQFIKETAAALYCLFIENETSAYVYLYEQIKLNIYKDI